MGTRLWPTDYSSLIPPTSPSPRPWFYRALGGCELSGWLYSVQEIPALALETLALAWGLKLGVE